ncbi:YwdI family protein [Bacillus sp. 165]|uniref:YwdI family protein n=1 Tax=Bacillus sp. 165 TaxID=1529117 RepID=UPI001ADCBDBF|nr:YwdI family protein [Bacillus sp. 165]MBO9130133.1 YwdI family protein [Bacillus sp. 165]
MQISIDKVLNKMSHEIKAAAVQKHNEQKMREHLTAIRALCELLLEESPAASTAISEREMAMMTGEWKNPKAGNVSGTASVRYQEEEDANGSSLFDF